MTLYELTGQYLQLLEMAMEPQEGEEDVLRDTMEAIDGELEDKADGYAKVITELKARADALDAEAKRLADRKRTIESSIARLKQSLQGAMEATGKEKFKTDLFSFGIQNNPPSVVLEEGILVPEKYLIPQEPKVDKAAIKEELKAGKVLEFAHLEQGKSLRIR